MASPTIVAYAGSLREGSFNKKLLKLAVAAARDAGALVTEADLRDFPMPLYDADVQEREGFPEHVRRFRGLLIANDAQLIASPEYNRSISGVLKNAIDWASRTGPGEPPNPCFSGKTAGILGASPGAIGTLCGLMHLRSILGNIGVLVIPEQVALPKAAEAFDESGRLKDAKSQGMVEKVGRRLAKVAGALKS